MTAPARRPEKPDMSLMADVMLEALEKTADSFRQPSFRAGFGAALLSTALLGRTGARPGVAILVSVMIGAAVEKLYGMAEDIHAAAVLKLESDGAAGTVRPG